MLLPIPAFSDNYIWLFADNGKAWVTDPGDAAPVVSALEGNNLQLSGILVTHHHGDHVGGISGLLEKFHVPVYGPALSPAAGLITHKLVQNDVIEIHSRKFEIISVPGHTLDHIAFYSAEANILLCGDTLFSAGCGRVFEGTYEQMYASLQKLAALPDDTQVCCAHEYTLSNLRFAQATEPDNQDIKNHITHCQSLRKQGKPTLPSTLALEKKINPFLRCADLAEFSARREWKNHY
ncbi:MAG TPA: hydroxyacylglutathione hydrolase [Pseudomonadales bacterium]|nr:hydroxyacylglutathione hydrolase [Pseudomonadales bacterium]